MRNRRRSFIGPVCALAMLVTAAGSSVRAVDINVDLDGTPANGRESNVKLAVVTTYPAKIKNTVTNKAVGQAFQFSWVSAGPGGFASRLNPGTTAGVGAIWTWETSQSIFSFTGNSCLNDICFTRTTDGAARGPFSAPGRSLSSSNVTVSNASLTSSLITFFSPLHPLVSVTSSVEQLASGGFRYTTRIVNSTTGPITVDLARGPLGCDTFCDKGGTNCGGVCVDTSSDPTNCGACNHHCSEGQVCSDGECTTSCPEGETNCGGECVNLDSDVSNCGECGYVCPTGECGSGVYCYLGTCQCGGGDVSPSGEGSSCEFPGARMLEVPASGVIEDCHTDVHPAKEVTSRLTVCGPSIPGGPLQCSSGVDDSEGTFNVFVPDTSRTIGDVFLTPYKVQVVDDPSGDGLIQPGETVKLKILLLNAGSHTLGNAIGMLSSPPVDLTEDGIANPVAVDIPVSTSAYQDLPGFQPEGVDACGGAAGPVVPAANVTPFVVSFPANHPGDVARPFFLDVTGDVAAGFSGHPAGHHSVTDHPESADDVSATGGPGLIGRPPKNVPLIVGIGGVCTPSNGSGDFDGLDGLLPPLTRLVLPGLDVPYPHNTFNQGRTLPLKLRLTCAGATVGAGAPAPEIVRLTRLGNPNQEIDVATAGLGDQPNRDTLFFRLSGQQWIYNMRTKSLPLGTYVLTIRMPNGQDYVTGFVLR